jgi:GntR family transcriptional repressor for pyruvate dehydrogenase complex
MDVFVPIRQKKISEEIVEQMKTLIFKGKLKPGKKLPGERDLAKDLNVSRVSLREALNTLQGMGLIEIQRGNRTFVRPVTTRSIYDPLVAYTKSTSLNLLKAFEVRKYLEVGSISLAAERATADEIRKLEGILGEMEEDYRKNRLGAKADHDFHVTLVEATHNEAYIHTLNTFYDLLQEGLRIAWGSVFKKRESRRKLFEQHGSIFCAVRAHDSQTGEREALAHMSFVEENWKAALMENV